MPTVLNKKKICETNLSDFSIEQIEGIPFYSRYMELERLLRRRIPNLDFGHCFAQPCENKLTKIIEWYYIPGNEFPIHISELSDDNYDKAVSQKSSIIKDIESAIQNSNEHERKYLSSLLAGITSKESDNTSYYYDGHVLLCVWGMRAKPGRNIEDVIREDVLDHRVFSIKYDIKGKGSLSFESINRKYGYRLSPSDVPQVTPSEGWTFKRWEPDIPQGWTVTNDTIFLAVCEKASDSIGGNVNPDEQAGISQDSFNDSHDEPVEPPTTDRFHVHFSAEEGGALQGETDCWKYAGEHLSNSEVPVPIPDDGYEFIGWDQQPEDYEVHDDIEFTARFQKAPSKGEDYHIHFAPDEGGTLQGETNYWKCEGERISRSEIPTPIPDEGYEFVGWDQQPEDYEVHNDVVFTAHFQESTSRKWLGFTWWGRNGCLHALLNWLLLILGLTLIFLLLWCFVFGKCHFNLCGCDCNDTIFPPSSNIDTIPPQQDSVPVPHTGDVQILLSWSNLNDLDIACTDPQGETVWYKNKQVSSGGVLDIDMNAHDETTRTDPIENIYWPTGQAPHGQYSVFLTYYAKNDNADLQTPYIVKVKHGETIDTYEGTLTSVKQKVPICTFVID